MSEPSLPIQYAFFALLVALSLVVGMLLAIDVGRRIGRRRIAVHGEAPSPGMGPVEGAVFGLLGLLIAFTFSGAAARFELRRQLIVEETNNIGTAYLRIDLLPADAQPPVRALFREYLNTRVVTYRKLPDLAAAEVERAKSVRLQRDIWQQVVPAAQRANSPAVATLLLPAVNAMFDIEAKRTMATWMHPPLVIYVMLLVLSLVSAVLAGYGMASTARSWVHMLAFALTLGLSAYVILDMEFPRLGLIQVSGFDRALIELRQSMQ